MKKKENLEPEKMPTKASKNLKVSNAKMLKELNESYKSNDFEKLLTTEHKKCLDF